MTRTESAQDICTTRHSLFARGLTHGRTGNLSVRLNGSILVTPSGVSLGDLTPDRLAEVALDGTHLTRPTPSKETFLHLTLYPARPNAAAVAHTHSTPPSSQEVAYYRADSAGSRLTPADIPAGLVEDAALLHVSGITAAQSPSARETLVDAVKRARSAGAPVSFDINYRASPWSAEEAGAFSRDLSKGVDLVFAGEHEGELVVEPHEWAEDTAAELAAVGPSEVVIKCGAHGALCLVDGTVYTSSAVPVDLVDTVGAGVAFVAGYLAERIAGAAPEARLQLAVRTGILVCMTPGDWEGLPRRDELSLLTDREPVRR